MVLGAFSQSVFPHFAGWVVVGEAGALLEAGAVAAGADGNGAGADTGFSAAGRDAPSMSEEVLFTDVYDSESDVSMKTMATAVVILPRKVPAPLLPKTV